MIPNGAQPATPAAGHSRSRARGLEAGAAAALTAGCRTRDLSGELSTDAMTAAILERL
jgi:isocitrate/isopropylmalate dehydrogenase